VNDLEKILRPKGLAPAKLQVQVFLFTTLPVRSRARPWCSRLG
jgi:hypothetical protein